MTQPAGALKNGEADDRPRNLDHLFGEQFPYCRGKFLLADKQEGNCIPCRDLLDPHVLNPIIARYADVFDGADRRAAASLWTLYYFSGLVIAPVVAWRAYGLVLPLSLDAMRLCLDPQTSAPSAFVLADAGHAPADASLSDAMDAAIFLHAMPLVETMAASVGLSKKVLWTNLVVYLDWIIRESAIQLGGEASEGDLALLEAPHWPDGRANPLAGLTRREFGVEGSFTRRRVCCLRYILPGVGGCGLVCPLPAGRE